MKNNYKHLYIQFAILALLLLGHWYFFVGYAASDDTSYMKQAVQYFSGQFDPPTTHWGFRYTIVLPLALLRTLGEYQYHTVALIPLLYFVGLFIFLGRFVARELGEAEAIFAAILIASTPLLVVQSTILSVDVAEAFFLTAAFFVFYQAEKQENGSWQSYFIAGVLSGLAMLTRETAYGFLLVLATFFVLGGYRRWQLYFAGLAGILCILSMEWIYYLSFDLDVLYRFNTVSESHGTVGIRTGDIASGTGNISDNRLIAPIAALLFNQEFALIFWGAIAGSIYLAAKSKLKQRGFAWYALIAMSVYSLWIGYSGAVRPLPRYFAFPTVLAVVIIAAALMQLKHGSIRYLALAAIVGASYSALALENIYPRFAAKEIASFAKHSELPVLAPEREAHRAQSYLEFEGASSSSVGPDDTLDANFVYAKVEGMAHPSDIDDQLIGANLIEEHHPPKLLAGLILDVINIESYLPPDLYHWLFIRNPSVRFYRVTR